ncbi:DUF4307 domain-containing protein [Leucobacter weissii]|uniref:DUF4307 domain-containing protein n=1 Tax=Leucobacter weissii TaxID=1983706 RepID=A0A939ML90_9MICO|nr:DUF4307 domain-containing protein [Leucobacter weissii]
MTSAPTADVPAAQQTAPGPARDADRSRSAAGADRAASLDERYGRSRRRGVDRRLGWAVAGGALLLGLVVLLFGGWQHQSSLDFREVHYRVLDERTVAVDFEVTAAPGAAVACALEALSTSYSTVGWKVVELPLEDRRTRMFTDTLVTTYPATTGTVRSCWLLEDRAAP